MPRPANLPKEFKSKGELIRWWRNHRKLSREELAELIDASVTSISDFELGRTKVHKKLHLMIAQLRLNPHYVDKGKGEPEAEFPQEAAPDESAEWPLPNVQKRRLTDLDTIERSYVEQIVNDALALIASERRKKKREV